MTRKILAFGSVKNYWINNVYYLTLLLLIYSMLPGIAKLLDARFIFTANTLIIMAMFGAGMIQNFGKSQIIVSAYIFYTIAHTTILVSMGYADENSAYTSYYMYVLPIFGFFIADRINPQILLRALMWIAFFHGILGFLFFELFGFASLIGGIAEQLTAGVFRYRMASVSGSIIFGATMVYGLISAAYFYSITDKKYYIIMITFFFVCILFSQQRGAWLAATLFMSWIIYQNRKKYVQIFLILCFILFSAYLLLISFPEMYDFIELRITATLGNSGSLNIVDERSHMWFGALEQFKLNPLGIGVGQGGWISYTQNVNESTVVTDGDYFRIALESGLPGLLSFIYILGFVVFSFFTNSNQREKYFNWLSLATALQMTGSNITELYYINFAFWLATGINHRSGIVEEALHTRQT